MPIGASTRVRLDCSDACTGACAAVTRTMGFSSPSARAESGTTRWVPAATTMPLPTAGCTRPDAP